MANQDLITRTISGFFFLVILIGTMMLTKQAFSILFFIFTLIALKEYISILSSRKHGVDKTMIYLTGLVVYLFVSGFSYFSHDHHLLQAVLPIAVIYPAYAVLNLFFKKVNDPGIHAPVLSSVLLIAMPFGLLNFLFTNENTLFQPVLAFFILLWSNDTFAYLTGKFFGRKKLMENVSPKKTWEGFIGGIAFAVLAGFLMKEHTSFLAGNNWVFIAVAVGVFGTLGDLYESRMKRWAGIKDSGQIMPGHGGLLDRFDGVMFSVVVVLMILGFC